MALRTAVSFAPGVTCDLPSNGRDGKCSVQFLRSVLNLRRQIFFHKCFLHLWHAIGVTSAADTVKHGCSVFPNA